MRMARSQWDIGSWRTCGCISVVVLAVLIGVVLFFLPYMDHATKTSVATISAPTPLPKDPNYYQDQGGGIYTDYLGNVYTGHIQTVNTLDGNWGKYLFGDELDAQGRCCDILDSSGWAIWFLYNGNGRSLGICSNVCNHKRKRVCHLGRNYFAFLLVAPQGADASKYNPQFDYTQYLPTFTVYKNTDVWLISPPIYACDRLVHVVVNGTVLA